MKPPSPQHFVWDGLNTPLLLRQRGFNEGSKSPKAYVVVQYIYFLKYLNTRVQLLALH